MSKNERLERLFRIYAIDLQNYITEARDIFVCPRKRFILLIVFQAESYPEKYAKFLKIDFPRPAERQGVTCLIRHD